MTEQTNQEHVYALYKDYGDKRQYFYVGRSSRSPGARLKEHIRNSQNIEHTEDVYQFIRAECEPCGIPIWDQEILCMVKEENMDDYEDFYVVRLTRQGHKLQNMKRGDAKRLAALEMAASDFPINTLLDIKKYKEHIRVATSERLRKSVLESGEIEYGSEPNHAFQEHLMQKMRSYVEQERAAFIAKSERLEKARKARELKRKEWLALQRALYNSGQIDALGQPIPPKK